MKTITIRVENDRDAELLKKVLQATRFEDKIEAIEEEEESNDVEIKMLEERWESYVRNPSSAITVDDFKKELKDKCGL
jgi:hypothetical protein